MSRSDNRVDTANLILDQLGIFAHPEKSSKLLTMHRSKGREFDAVALVDMHDRWIPHAGGSVDEGRRLLYVAITRTRQLLLYITDTEHWQNRPSRFLAELGL
jgi:DNA helicase-2/ATP-dependent DNA helicase PcrA